jgi:hypothetical protein
VYNDEECKCEGQLERHRKETQLARKGTGVWDPRCSGSRTGWAIPC